MRLFFLIFVFLLTALASSCSRASEPATPLETYKTYVKAIKQKDTTTMKLLLSNESIKMHEQQARAQNVTIDEIVRREPLFSENQRTLEYRNERISGDAATLEVKNAADEWDTVPFIRENGVWKIDKKAYADQFIKNIDLENQQFEDKINRDRQMP